MSTKIGTVQPPIRLGPSAWLAGLLAVLVGATVAVVAISFDSPEEASRGASVRGTAANTPTEVRGGFMEAPAAGGTLANTPSELSGGYAIVERMVPGRVANVQARHGGNPAAGRRASVAQPVELPAGLSLGVAPVAVSGTLANTPSELSGGIVGSVVGTLANTPSELSGGVIGGIDVGRVADAARWRAQADAYLESVGGRFNTAELKAQAEAYVDSLVGFSARLDAIRWQGKPEAYVDSMVGFERGRLADATRLQAQADAYVDSLLAIERGRFADAARLQAQADAYPAAHGDERASGRRGVTPRMSAEVPDEIVVNGEVCHQCQ